MSDIFAEVDAELRRDRWKALWDRYGLLVICGAVGIVLLVAIFVGYRAFQQSQNEAASLRYEALLQQIGEDERRQQDAGYLEQGRRVAVVGFRLVGLGDAAPPLLDRGTMTELIVEIAYRHQQQQQQNDPRPAGCAEFVNFNRLIEFK